MAALSALRHVSLDAVRRLPVTEKQLMQAVVELAQLLGYLTYHTYDSRRSNMGFPDLVLARPGRLVFAELKAERGKVSPAQTVWARLLSAAPAEVFLWRPSDWTSGAIEAALRAA